MTLDDSRAGALAMIARGYAEQLAESDLGFPGLVQRECFRQVLLREHSGVQAVGNRLVKLLEHNPTGNAGVSLPGGGHVRVRVPVRPAKILLEYQIAVAHDEQAAILGTSLRELRIDRKSTRLNSSHTVISYAVFCLKKKRKCTEKRNKCDLTMA